MTASVTERVIRLAHEKPELRPKLLGMVMRAKAEARKRTAAKFLNVGDGFEDERAMLRFHRFRDSLKVWDLTNAGKRGKKVNVFVVTGLDQVKSLANGVVEQVVNAAYYAHALKFAKTWVDTVQESTPFVHLYESSERGVDVTPAGFRPITVDGQHVYIQAEYDSFRVKDKVDLANEPTCIPAIRGGKKDIKVFYRWVKDNQSKLKGMKFHDVLRAMMSEGIKYHQYCAMD